jgi:signal transduction histidine kinase/ActR/RegA family two-component response regulator
MTWVLDFDNPHTELDYLQNRWYDTRTLKRVIVWGIGFHNILVMIEQLVFTRMDLINIISISVLWIIMLFALYFLYFLYPITRKRITVWWLLITVLSIIYGLFINMKSLICYYNPLVNLDCLTVDRPRLRFEYYYLVLGPIFALLVLDNNRTFEVFGLLVLTIIYIWSAIVSGLDIGSVLVDICLVIGAFIAIIYVSYIYEKISRHVYVLNKQLEKENNDRKRAEELQREESQKRMNFTNYIFHELRVPLNALMLNISYLERDDDFLSKLTHEEKQVFDSLDLNLGSMETILTDSLDYEKLSRGFFQLQEIPFLFNKTVKSMVTAMEWTWRGKGQTFEMILDEAIYNSPYLPLGDEMRLRQIIANYLSNAVKYTPQGGHIALKTKQESITPTTQVIYLEVKDNGIGISPEDQVKLFKPFVQIGSSSTRNMQKGTGLGLSISGELIKRMNGIYGVQSKLGEGSVFWARIPFKVSNMRRTVTEHENSAFDQSPIVIRKRRRDVLLVDDDPLTLLIMSKMLKRDGHTTTTASDGEEALVKINKRSKNGEKMFDVVFMDELMPRLTGVEAILRLRRGGFEVPIIALTGDTQVEKREEFLKAGATHVLYKPASWALIEKTLQILP